MTDVTSINTGAVGDKIVRTESGAFIVLAGVQTALDMTAAANSGLALLKPHSTITVHSTGPTVLYTSILSHAHASASAAELNGAPVNAGGVAWTTVATTASASTAAAILSGLATYETAFEGHA
jgi:hypothetical protein